MFITLPEVQLVFLRTAIAALCLAALIGARPGIRLWVGRRDALMLTGNGLLIGLHWILFFKASKIAVSICMVGMATSALWTALLEPILLRRRRIRASEIAIGAVMVAAMAQIAGVVPDLAGGLLIAVASAFVATIFAVFNGAFATRHHHWTIAFYGMVGAAGFCGVCLIAQAWGGDTRWQDPLPMDWVWLAVLAIACTVVAYSEYVELLKRLTVFSVSVAYNLEPVYGIVLGALILAEYKFLNPGFYAGAAVILGAVCAQPFLERWMRRREETRR